MSRPHAPIPNDLFFFASEEHPCSYLPGEDAVTLFADPKARMTPQLYSALSDLGFRRSGEYVYAPRCPRCHACLPARLPVQAFKPGRSQRRNMAMNRDLEVRVLPAQFNEGHFALYQRYIQSRHPEGSMATPDREQYNRFFSSSWSDTRYVEFSLDGQPLAVAVIDLLERGLSAVYTFFEPAEHKRGLGVFAVLWMIEEIKRRGLPYLYLGYLIRESRKMAYKAHYRPLEVFRDGRWQPLE
jgi:arginine-tRNA-protein transferase